MAATACNIRLIVDTLVAYCVTHGHGLSCWTWRLRHATVAVPRFQSFDQCWVGLCTTFSLSVLYSERCLEDITFQIEWMLTNQSQKYLCQYKIPDFFVAKSCKIMRLRFLITNWICQLLVGCTIVNTSINLFCFCERLLLGHKCVQFNKFSPISQYLDDVRLETTIFG